MPLNCTACPAIGANPKQQGASIYTTARFLTDGWLRISASFSRRVWKPSRLGWATNKAMVFQEVLMKVSIGKGNTVHSQHQVDALKKRRRRSDKDKLDQLVTEH